MYCLLTILNFLKKIYMGRNLNTKTYLADYIFCIKKMSFLLVKNQY